MSISLNNIFNLKRFFYLSKVELINNWRIYLLKDLIIVLIFVNLTIFSNMFNSVTDPYGFFVINLFLGVIFTSLTFNQIHNKESGIAFLMLPCSIEEKFFVKLLFTTLVYFVFAFVSIFVASLVVGLVKFAFFKVSFTFLNPVAHNIFKVFLIYIYFHSMFFFGAVFFKKNNFLFTALSMIVIILVLMILFSFIFVNFFAGLTSGYNNSFNFNNLANIINNNTDTINIVFKIIFGYLIPPVLYILSYLKLKRIELR